MEQTVFPEFVFAGTMVGAIQHLMDESKKVTPDGRPVGGFILRVGMEHGRLVITLRGRNALEVIDALCAHCGGQWMVAPYAVVISPRSATAPSREK